MEKVFAPLLIIAVIIFVIVIQPEAGVSADDLDMTDIARTRRYSCT